MLAASDLLIGHCGNDHVIASPGFFDPLIVLFIIE
jgi:hypothetical protein